MNSKPKCTFDNCNNVAMSTGKNKDNSKRYDKFCSYHHKKKYNMPFGTGGKKRIMFPNKQCILCGWNGPCDRHRVEQGGEYIQSNVLVLCPNCHRLLHFKEWGYA